MGKREAEEETNSEILHVMEKELSTQNQHPYAFHVSGPRNVPSINWRDLISSNWSKDNLRVLFVSAVYLSLMNEKLSKKTQNDFTRRGARAIRAAWNFQAAHGAFSERPCAYGTAWIFPGSEGNTGVRTAPSARIH